MCTPFKIRKKIKSREDFKTSSFPPNYLFTYTVHIIKTSKLLLPNPHNVRGPESTCGPSATSGLTDPWRCKNAAPPPQVRPHSESVLEPLRTYNHANEAAIKSARFHFCAHL